jgi:hypothetical protein
VKSHTRDKRKAYEVLFGKPEGNIPLGRPRLRRKNNIKVGLAE